MIGEHSVSVSATPSGDPFGAVFNKNPNFTTDASLWALYGSSPPLVPVWSAPGGLTFTRTYEGSGAAGNAISWPGHPWTPYPEDQLRIRARVRVDTAPAQFVLSFRQTSQTAIVPPASGSVTGPTWNIGIVTLNTPGWYTVQYQGVVGTHLKTDFTQHYLCTAISVSKGNIFVDSIEGFIAQPEYLPVDISCLVDSVQINHGRDDTTSQPDASTATIDVSWENGVDTPPPDVLEIGGGLFVDTEFPPGSGSLSRRFAGRVTDISYGWEDAGEDTPDRVTAQIVGAGYMADLARRVVGDEPWPEELDGARVARVLDLAGVTLNPATSDPGTVQILPRDVDSQPALDVAQGVAESARGMVWENRAGGILYADAEHRRNIPVSVRLDACDVLVTPTWSRTTEGLINAVSLGYGPTPDEGEQPRYIASRPDSITRFGTYQYSLTTELSALADAQSMASLLLTRNSAPVWIFTSLPVDMVGLDADDTAAVLALDVHSLLEVTGLPAAGAAPTTATLWVEGWTETLADGVHDIQLAVSGYCRTSPAPRWDDIAPEQTWDTVTPASLTWDDITCLGPPTNYGRWNDVPASLRWNGVAPAITWDTWKV
jgi:hypothetical protein